MTTFIVNGQEKELVFRENGIDISRALIGNTYHGMDMDDEGNYIADQDEYTWWENYFVGLAEMNETITQYKENFDSDEVDRVVNDWINVDFENQSDQVIHGLKQTFGEL